MKHLLRLLPLNFLHAPAIFAGNVRFPSDGAMKLVMKIPDGWKTSVDKEGVLSAESPDEELALAAWAVDKAELENFKDAPNKLGRILADCVTGICDHTGIIECELFAATYRRFGIQTVRSPVVEIEATVTPFENGRGCTLDVHRVGKARGRWIPPSRKLVCFIASPSKKLQPSALCMESVKLSQFIGTTASAFIRCHKARRRSPEALSPVPRPRNP